LNVASYPFISKTTTIKLFKTDINRIGYEFAYNLFREAHANFLKQNKEQEGILMLTLCVPHLSEPSK